MVLGGNVNGFSWTVVGLNINNYIFACLANKSKTLLITEEREPYFYDTPESSCEAYDRSK